MFNNTVLSTTIFLITLVSNLFGQTSNYKTVPDSLKTKSFDYLSEKFRNSNEKQNIELYSRAYLEKAKKTGDKERMITGLLQRGSYYYIIRDFPAAIDYHVKGYELAKGIKDQNYLNRVNHNIGAIRVRSGEYKKALEAFKITLDHYQNNPEKIIEEQNNYHVTLFSIANAYRRLKMPDSAFYFTKIGLDNLKEKNLNYYNYLLTNTILKIKFNHDKQDFLNKRLDSIIQFYSKNKKRTDPNIAFAYFYLGKLLLKQNDTIKAIANFKKIDSLFKVHNDIHPELRPTYEYLINFNKRNGNIKNELKYVKTLLKVDSTLNENYRHLDTKIYKEYETPRLIEQKNKLISLMQQKSNVATIIIVSLSIILFLSIILIAFNYRKRRIYHQRYIELIEKNKKLQLTNEDREQANTKKNESTSNLLSSIPEEIVSKVKDEIKKFIEEKKFTDCNLTSTTLASKFGTNTKYLSLIIKSETGKTFTKFLNDLRIEYALKKIQNDSTFRKFTIQAIAEECGFNTAEVFSKHFFKKTGIYPSYFIKKLKEDL
ncbi:AraC family transcriptional regulator [Aquimarina brevivitae]|uniref:AraC-like DNA-binding protein n=1 Tax=Aquimarina brevivitae TaxID=323412 RepID=A0A4Q7P580_9FLAO|nr:AraC family transcriptional regulator [Aquimarina brevivitae]RZS93872.1 AraC-like DNA-binding protein [Aquimarina brevivitae]